jgi:hypothetical protein
MLFLQPPVLLRMKGEMLRNTCIAEDYSSRYFHGSGRLLVHHLLSRTTKNLSSPGLRLTLVTREHVRD